MADIGLRTYLHQIDGLIEQKQLDEAIAHCKHVLAHYPKSLETYRLLGKALLEKSRHGDAADIFQRVLSAVPEDFVAHVGMSIVREDEANQEAALWHMERAFEANPGNTAIQEQLRRLYGKRDGVVPPRARLTRGALARLYVKGELYPQAEAELRAALADEPERLDLLTLLARVLAASGRPAEAADLCHTLLQKLPYSLEGNRLLAEIFAAQNRPDDARPHRQRLEALDPYEAFADGRDARAVRDESVRLPELAQTPEELAAPPETPDWAVSLGETLDTPFAAPAADTALGEEPDWLKSGTGMLHAEPAAFTEAADLPAPGDVPDWLKDVEPVSATPPPELPDWMKATTGMLADAPSETGEKKKRKTGSLSEWLKPEDQPVGGQPPAEAELPDWMKDIVPAEAPPEPAPLAEDAEAASTTRLDELPEWMRSSTQETTALPAWMTGQLSAEAKSAPGESGAELPAWMRSEVEPGVTGKLEDLGPADTMPEWLKAARAASGVPAPELPAWALADAEPAVSPEDLPDWLKTATAETGEPVTAEPPEALPGWMTTAAEEPPAPAPSVQPAVELPDFLQLASPEAIERANQPVEWEAEPQTAEAAPVEASGVPDWIKAMAPDTNAAPLTIAEDELPPVASDELPDWLRPGAAAAAGAALAAGLAASPEPAAPEAGSTEAPPDWLTAAEAEPAVLPTPSAEMPDWLRAMAAEPGTPTAAEAEPAVLPTPSAEMPDWLRAMAAEPGTPAFESASTEAEPPAAAANSAAPTAAADLPDWLTSMGQARGEAPEAEPHAAQPAEIEPASELPNWLKAAAGEPEEAAPGAATPAASAADAMPDLSTMDADEAMRWLETLAARQGAAPEELITTPEERLEKPPAWVSAPAEPAAAAEALPDWAQAEEPVSEEAAEIQPSEKNIPDWLRRPGEPVVAPPADWLRAPVEAPEPETGQPALPDWLAAGTGLPAEAAPIASSPETEAAPDLSTMDADEAMRWLETLAARQGAAPEELITAPEERLEKPPDWVGQTESSPVMPPTGLLPDSFAVKEPTPFAPGDSLPDWLQELQAEAASQPEPAAAAAPPPEAEATPDLSTMDADEAMRWLETLAARQGAAPEELITAPEERLETPPDWLKHAETGPIMPPTGLLPDVFQTEEAPPAQTGAIEPGGPLPDWLQELQAEAASQPEPAAAAAPPPEAEAAPDLSTMDADEAMRWLETLAARQGAAPEELTTAPEERPETPPARPAGMPAVETAGPAPEARAPAAPVEPEAMTTSVPAWLAGWGEAEQMQETPDWLKAVAEPAAPEAEPASSLPDWIKALAGPEEETPLPPEPAPAVTRAEAPPDWVRAPAEPPAEPRAEEKPAEPPVAPAEPKRREAGDERLSRLAEKLAAGRRAKDAEVAERLEKQRAEREAAQREVAQKMEERRSRQPGTGPLRPGTGPLRPEVAPLQPKTGPLPAAETVAEKAPAPPSVKPAPTASRVPTRLARASRKGRGKSPYAGQPPADLLQQARQRLSAGDPAGAAEIFGHLTHHGHQVPEVILELEAATFNQPSAAPLFQALGDAYMRANQLQKALDAYRQALAQL